MNAPQKIEISHRTIIFTVLFLMFIWLLYFIREILVQFFVALLLMTILNPFVTRLAQFKIPRAASILLAYLIVFGLLGVAIAGIATPLIEQSTKFANGIPSYIENIGASSIFSQQLFGEIFSLAGQLPAGLARFGVSIFSNVVSVVAVLVFSFYLLLSRDKLDDQLGVFFGSKTKHHFNKIIDLLEDKLGGWVRGQVSLMTLIGITTYVGLMILGIPFALPLAILAGLLEIIPYLGPVASAIPAIMIGLGISPIMGLAVVALYFLIQQLENFIFVPKVMEKSAGVTPIVTLLALAIGFKIAGILGVIISVPVVITLQVLLEEYVFSK